MSLTKSQQHAITTPSKEVLCAAGSGAGKTKVLIGRIIHHIQQGASAQDFLVVTFTRKAAMEMKLRLAVQLKGIVDNPNQFIAGMLIGTFHAIGLRILKTEGARLGLRENLTVARPHEADALLKSICEEMGFLRNGSWKRISWGKIERYRENVYSGAGNVLDRDCERVFCEYRNRLHEMSVLDYGSILQLTLHILETDIEVRDKYKSRIKHVLVDEMQDTDLVQYKLRNVFSPDATFFGCFDLRQSIYGFRNARPDLAFDRQDAEVIYLQENFRSGSQIVEAANRLIGNNPEGEVPMIPAVASLGSVSTHQGQVLPLIYSLRDDGYAWNDIAIIARTHASLEQLKYQLTSSKIPHYHVGSGFDICSTEEFQTIHAGMRLRENHGDDLSFLVLREAFHADMVHLRAHAALKGCSLFSAYCDLVPGELTQWFQGDTKLRVAGDLVGFIDAAFGNAGTKYLPVVRFWTSHCPAMTFNEALDWYATYDVQDDMKEEGVTLITGHASKGLEWPACVLMDTDREFREDEEDEERRVFYVSLTRARERVVLQYETEPNQFVLESTNVSRVMHANRS